MTQSSSTRRTRFRLIDLTIVLAMVAISGAILLGFYLEVRQSFERIGCT
jgi:hypothetical protein